MNAVILRPNWPGVFRRIIRDKQGQPAKTLEFAAGKPVELNAEDLAAVRNDIGKALAWAALGPDGKPNGKPDYSAEQPQPPAKRQRDEKKPPAAK